MHAGSGFRFVVPVAHCGDVFDSRVLKLAGHQHGVLATWQLRERLDISSAAISRARRNGMVADIAPGVVRISSSPETFRARCFALHLRLRGDGFLTGPTAGHLYGMRSMPTNRFHATVDRSFRRSVPTWARVHRSSWFLPRRDSQIGPDGLDVATPLRTLWALAADFSQHRFERAAEDAWHLGLVTPVQASDYLEQHRCRGKDGVLRFETWLERALGQERPAQSDLERILLEALDRCGLRTPVRQYPLVLASGATVLLDIAWPDIRLAVEPGHAWFHGGDEGQRRDQARDRACIERGWQIVRFDETLRADPDAAAREVAVIERRRRLEARNWPRS